AVGLQGVEGTRQVLRRHAEERGERALVERQFERTGAALFAVEAQQAVGEALDGGPQLEVLVLFDNTPEAIRQLNDDGAGERVVLGERIAHVLRGDQENL